jgi:hypothetical protein
MTDFDTNAQASLAAVASRPTRTAAFSSSLPAAPRLERALKNLKDAQHAYDKCVKQSKGVH